MVVGIWMSLGSARGLSKEMRATWSWPRFRGPVRDSGVCDDHVGAHMGMLRVVSNRFTAAFAQKAVDPRFVGELCRWLVYQMCTPRASC